MAVEKNVGGIDRTIRIIVGIILLLTVPLAFVGPQTPWAYLGLVGIVIIATAIIGYCPPYALLGINTYKRNENQE